MNEIQSKTCLRFSPINIYDIDYIRIINGVGCSSYVGRIGNSQDVTLQRNGCISKGTAMHELIHAIGFKHQHSHYERDQKITILWNNITPGKEHNFDITSSSSYSNYETAFDIGSIMHYKDDAFGINGKKTIQAKNPADQNKMGQRSAMSTGDIIRINNMYEC